MEGRAGGSSGGPLRRRDFRLLWAGEAVSSLGDQFAFIALPWLSLVLTGSALALGGVLALMAVPRAVLLLIGGVAVDRFSPRRVMFASNLVRLATVAVLAGLVLADAIGLPSLYLFALVFGIADAFFWPAQQAIVPALVEPAELPAANAIVQGTTQITVFVGPLLAGLVIAGMGASATQPTLGGIAVALLVDAASFIVSLATLTLIRGGSLRPAEPEPVVEALKAGLRVVWRWPSLRFVVLLAMAMNLLVVGPLEVGLPMIAYQRLPEGAAAYGAVMGALGAGSLLGMVAVAAAPAPPPRLLGPVVLSVAALIGLGDAALGLVSSTGTALAVALVAGFGTGYVNLTFITWVQQRVPAALRGRVFGVVLLGSVGLIPLSQLIAGAFVGLSLTGTMVVSGLAMTALTLLAATRPTIRAMGLEPIAAESAGQGTVDGASGIDADTGAGAEDASVEAVPSDP